MPVIERKISGLAICMEAAVRLEATFCLTKTQTVSALSSRICSSSETPFCLCEQGFGLTG